MIARRAATLGGDPYGLGLGGLVVGRRLHYRWRHGVWCEHPHHTGQLVDTGMRKLWTCHGCGHRTFRPRPTLGR